MFEVARNYVHFFQHESCGFCTPCRVGTSLLKNLMDKLHNGCGSPYDFAEIEKLNQLLQSMSHCGLGHTACNPVLDTIAKFRPAYDGGWRSRTSRRPSISTARWRGAADDRARRSGRPYHQGRIRGGRMSQTFTLDGKTIPFADGQTIMQAATQAGVFIPHLCYHPEFKPHGSCKLCTVKVNGRQTASCTMRASPAWSSKAIPRKSTPNAGR
jgi:ferredoxin